MKGKLELKLISSTYAKVGDEYKTIEAKEVFSPDDWDDWNNLLGYMLEAKHGNWLKFEARLIEEETNGEA